FGRGMPAFHTLHCDLRGVPNAAPNTLSVIIPGPNPVILYLWSYSSPESHHRYKITGLCGTTTGSGNRWRDRAGVLIDLAIAIVLGARNLFDAERLAPTTPRSWELWPPTPRPDQ